MAANLIAKTTITVNAPASVVWDALTNPKLIKEYFFGTEAISDWKVGSPLHFKGVWEGKEYLDKGTILQSIPEKLFQYSYWSSFSGLPDAPENYANIVYELEEENSQTMLTVKQENIADEEKRQHSEKNWAMILNKMKELVENEHQVA